MRFRCAVVVMGFDLCLAGGGFLQSLSASAGNAINTIRHVAPPGATPTYVNSTDLPSFSLDPCPKVNQGPLALDFAAMLQVVKDTKSVLTWSYDHWWVSDGPSQNKSSRHQESSARSLSSLPPGTSDSRRMTSEPSGADPQSETPGHTTNHRVFARVPLVSNLAQGVAYNRDGRRKDFTLEAVNVFAPSINVHDLGSPMSLELQFEHRAAVGVAHAAEFGHGPTGLLISNDGRVLDVDSGSTAFQQGVQAGWTIVDIHGQPYNEDLVASYKSCDFKFGVAGMTIDKTSGEVLEVESTGQGHELGVKVGWKVVHTEPSSDHALRIASSGTWVDNEKGVTILFALPRTQWQTSTWFVEEKTHATFYEPPQVLGLSILFNEVDEAEELPLLRWLNDNLRQPGGGEAKLDPFDASTLIAQIGKTQVVHYKAGAALPPCSNDMLWFVTTEVLQVPPGLLRDIKESLRGDSEVEHINAREWNSSVEERVRLVHLQDADDVIFDLGFSKYEIDDRQWYFCIQFALATVMLVVYTSSIFLFPWKRVCQSAPSTMVLLLTTDQCVSVAIRMLIRIMVYVFFMVIFVLPLMNYKHAQCRTGYPWEAHMMFFYFIFFTRTLEITLIAVAGVNSRYSKKVKFWLYVATVFKQIISILAATDMYTDANFVLIAYACQWDWWVMALLTFVVGVLVLQSFPKWAIGVYYLVQGFREPEDSEQHRMNEMMAWCKLLHMENVVQYMGANLVRDEAEEEASVYQKPTPKPSASTLPDDHSQLQPLNTLLQSKAEMNTMMEVYYADYSLLDRRKMGADLSALRDRTENVTRTRERRAPDPQRPSEPVKPTQPTEPKKPTEQAEQEPLVSAREEDGENKDNDEMATYEARMVTYKEDMAMHEREMTAYETRMVTYKEEMDKYKEQVQKLKNELAEFERELETHLGRYRDFKDHVNAFNVTLANMEYADKLKKRMDALKVQVNVADSSLRCCCEDFFQAGLQILFLVTFKFNVVVLLSVIVGLSISTLNVCAAIWEYSVRPPVPE